LEEAPIPMWVRRIALSFKGRIENFFGVTYFNRCFSQIGSYTREPNQFAKTIEAFQLKYSAVATKDSELPSHGAFIVVCNHPHGLWDGVIVGDHLLRARACTKIVASFLTNHLIGFEQYFISVDPRSNKRRCKLNQDARLTMRDQLCSGQPLVICPAGQVSRFNLRNLSTKDTAWTNLPIELATRFNVPIIPIFIGGKNSWWYQLVTMYSLTLANALLVREFRLMAGKPGRVVVGKAISPNDLDQFDGKTEKTRYIRAQTYALSNFM